MDPQTQSSISETQSSNQKEIKFIMYRNYVLVENLRIKKKMS